MYEGFGRGRGAGTGTGGGKGFGFRGSSPPWPYVGKGRGGLSRCAYYTGISGTTMSREEELNHLKKRAQAIRDDLEKINARIRDMEENESKK